MADDYVPENAYPTNPLNRFVTGFQGGLNLAYDLAKKSNELKLQNYNLIAAKKLADAGDKPTGSESGDTGMPEKGLAESSASASGGTTGSGAGGAGGAGGGGGKNAVSPDVIQAFMLNNLGATPQEAATLMGQMGAESNFRPDVLHDGGIGYGLFGHNGSRLANMRTFAGVGPNDSVPWQRQVAFGLDEFRSRPEGKLVNQAQTPEEATKLGFQFEQPAGYQNPTAHPTWGSRLAGTAKYWGAQPTSTAMVEDPSVPALAQVPSLSGALGGPGAAPAVGALAQVPSLSGALGGPGAAPAPQAVGLPALSSKYVFGTPTPPGNVGHITPSEVRSYGQRPAGATSPVPPGYRPPPAVAGAAPAPQAALVPPASPLVQLAQLYPQYFPQQQAALIPVRSGLYG